MRNFHWNHEPIYNLFWWWKISDIKETADNNTPTHARCYTCQMAHGKQIYTCQIWLDHKYLCRCIRNFRRYILLVNNQANSSSPHKHANNVYVIQSEVKNTQSSFNTAMIVIHDNCDQPSMTCRRSKHRMATYTVRLETSNVHRELRK